MSTNLRINEGGVTTMVASPLPGGGSYANIRAALTVRASDGSILCEQETTLVESWVVAFSDRRIIEPGRIVPLSCSFYHDLLGRAVSARIELRNRVWTFGGEAVADARASYPLFTQSHCGLELGWCTHAGAQLLAFDMTGDGKTDQLCHTPSTSHLQVNLTPDNGIPKESVDFDVLGFCGGSDALLTGDVNGDGKDDLVCVSGSRRVRVKFSTGRSFDERVIESLPAAPTICQRPLLADFDGDGDDDLMCQFVSGARPNVERADGTGVFTATDFTVPSCISSATLRGEYFAGDVDHDGRADLVCHEGGSTPRKIVFLASETGEMTRMAPAVATYCSHTGARLVLADADGDGRNDLVCLSDSSGYIHVDLASSTGGFDGVTARSADARFCVGGGSLVRTDFNGDGADELACHQTSPARNLFLPRF
ncbi:MAG: FG-GAP repeat domain-containing protein [Myxococcota bacterium]